MKSILLSVWFLLIITLCSSGEKSLEKKKQEMLDDLLDPENYDKRVRPQGSRPTNVSVSIYVLDIFDVDEYLKDFTLQCYFRQKWRDERLVFADNEEPKMRKIRSTESDKFWKPDLFFVNEIKGEMHDIMIPNRFLQFQEDGEVLFSNRVSVILSCDTNLKFYPHDEQKCYVVIESYAFSAAELSLEWAGDDPVGFNEPLSSDSKYILLGHDPSITTAVLNETTYSRLELELHFSRNSHPFLISVYLPQIALVILSWASFCINHKNVTLRLIYLGLIIFLTLRLIPNDRDPDLHITALDIWIVVCIIFILASFLESIFVNQLAKEEDFENATSLDAEQQAINSGHMSVEKEEKKSDSSGNKIFARFMKKYNSHSKRVDVVCRTASPILFLLFNIIYWSVCCSASS